MKQSIWRNPVFLASGIVIGFLVIIGAVAPRMFGNVAGRLYEWTTTYFGWFYLLSVFFLIVFLIGLALSKFGRIRLGDDQQKPDYPLFTWIGMLFSAGFGVGLVFWGVAEPMSHFFSPPFANMTPESNYAARVSMGYAFFHWGISQWSVFVIVGLLIAFLQFRKNKQSLVSTALEPVVGKRLVMRNVIDSLAVIATVMGVATSVGLGVLQMNGGLNAVLGTANSIWIQFGIIAIVFVAYMISATTGLDKGIRILSNFNLGLALAVMVFVFVMGPTVFILESFTLGLGDYISNFIGYSLRMQPYVGGTWIRDWTIFYWAWAISWSPFVGAFVARVSRGRTIREFIVGVMVVPPLIACVWVAVFGGTALWYDLNLNTGIAALVDEDLTAALFVLFEQLPFSILLSAISIFLILTFLVTSVDSAIFIMASMTTNGSLNPPTFVKYVWGVLVAAIAGVLLYAGGLEALQTASLVSALPFTVVILLMMVAIFQLLRKEPLPILKRDIRRFRRIEEVVQKQKKEKGKS